MSGTANTRPAPTRWTRGAAILALIFGVMTIVSGGSVLFGGEAVRAQAGNVVQIVVWFNFMAGFAYVLAGVGIWTQKTWAFTVSIAIALATLAVAAIFAWMVMAGAAFEMRTVGALILRLSVWAGISALIRPRRA
jgi:hypothetical protein